jgi:hypothetical protein
VIKLSARDVVAGRTQLGSFWISPDGQLMQVFVGDNKCHGDWGRSYLKDQNMSDQDIYDYFLSKNWIRIRSDVVEFAQGALNTAKDFLRGNVKEEDQNGEIVVNIWPNGLTKHTSPIAVIEADSVYQIR